MGMDATILAVGAFKKIIAPHLEYGSYDDTSAYDEVPEGTMVISEFSRCNTTSQSIALADALGVEVRDIATHFLGNAEQVDVEAVATMMGEEGFFDETITEFREGFRALRAAGFVFFYRPNS